MKKVIEVQEDNNGELFLEFDPSMLSQMGWHEGDLLEWIDNGDGSFIIQKKENDDE